MADRPQILTSQQADRLRRMLLDYESGLLTNPNPQPLARQSSPQWILVKIISPASGASTYNVQLLRSNTSDRSSGADGSLSDFGTAYSAPDGVSYLAIDALGFDAADDDPHPLPNGSVWPAFILRRQTDGTIVVGIWGLAFTKCSDGSSSASGGE